MYGLNEIAEYVRARYEESLAEKFAGQKFDNIDSRFKSTATKMLADGLAKEIIGEKPSIDPRKVAAIFKRYNPKIEKRTESGKKRSERIKIHNDAAKAYTLGLANSLGYIEDVKDELKLSTLDRQILSKMDKNARISFCENYPQTLESYYKDWNPAANEEKAARIGQATKSLNKVYFDAIKKLIEDRAKVFKKTLDDKSLIKEYGSIAADCELIRNAAELLDKISANKPEGVTEDQINECKNSINKLLPNAVKYQERMAIMADPYYPYINLETLLSMNPVKLPDDNYFVRDIFDVMPGATITYDMKDTVEKRYRKMNGFLAQKYANIACFNENVFRLPLEIKERNHVALEAEVCGQFGKDMKSIRENMLFCDKEGKLFDLGDKNLEDAVYDKGGEIYVIDRANKKVVPVVVLKTKNSYKILAGKNNIADAVEKYQEPTGNDTDKEKYLKRLKTLAKGEVPDFVNNITKNLDTLDEKREKHQAAMDNIVKGFKHIPYDDNREAFERALTAYLVSRALVEGTGPLHRIVCNTLKLNKNSFLTNNTINDPDIYKIEKFREFLAGLQNPRERFFKLDPLYSDDIDKVKGALDKITEKFIKEFNKDNPWEGKVNEAVRKMMEAEKAQNGAAIRVLPNKVFNKHTHEELEERFNNKLYWDTVMSIYGAKRSPRLDWVSETSTKNVYSMKEFLSMRENEIDLDECKIDGEALDEQTFASLAMMSSLRPQEFFTKENLRLLKEKDAPDTMPFEDIFSFNGEPRAATSPIIEPIVENTRNSLKENLKDFNGNGKNAIAKDLAEKLKIYVKHASKFGWDGNSVRTNATLTQVADKVLNFIDKHNMMDDIKRYGLTDEELKFIKITSVIGRLANEAHNAVTTLKHYVDQYDPSRHGFSEKKLTKDECLECINKIVRFKSVLADLKTINKDPVLKELNFREQAKEESDDAYNVYRVNHIKDINEENNKIAHNHVFKYDGIMNKILEKPDFVDEMADAIVPMETRKKWVDSIDKVFKEKKKVKSQNVVDKDVKEFLKNIECGDDEMVKKASDRIKEVFHAKLNKKQENAKKEDEKQNVVPANVEKEVKPQAAIC